VLSATSEPAHEALPLLIDQPVGQVRRLLDQSTGSLVDLLLDEIPVATLISGASSGRRGVRVPMAGGPGRMTTAEGRPKLDICAGWAVGGHMATRAEAGEARAFSPGGGHGPTAPSLLVDDDPVAWHELDDLTVSSMRRHRRLDLAPLVDGAHALDALFRDVYIEADGSQTIIHEYGVTGSFDPALGVLTALEASPHVLPGPDCPAAAASAAGLVGLPIDEVRRQVRSTFRGPTTCTHLNDELRAIGDLHALVALAGVAAGSV
jgi:hypothetical protein